MTQGGDCRSRHQTAEGVELVACFVVCQTHMRVCVELAAYSGPAIPAHLFWPDKHGREGVVCDRPAMGRVVFARLHTQLVRSCSLRLPHGTCSTLSPAHVRASWVFVLCVLVSRCHKPHRC